VRAWCGGGVMAWGAVAMVVMGGSQCGRGVSVVTWQEARWWWREFGRRRR